MRSAEITRKTTETDISLSLSLEGTGKKDISTGCGFLDHMLTLFTVHGSFDLVLKCKGDTEVDYHHTAEDIGICLGNAFKEALGDKKGIKRYSDIILPMDEALILASIDVSGRSYLGYDAAIPAQKVGDFDTELVLEFFLAFVRSSSVTLHIRQITGSNSHHIIEGMFKAFARVLSCAVSIDEKRSGTVMSTKGVL